ncbi:Hypothetical protein FKW44_006214, partial [Caligus rogercresseyi]
LNLINDDIKFVDMKTAFCRHCESSFESRQKGQVKQHIESEKKTQEETPDEKEQLS